MDNFSDIFGRRKYSYTAHSSYRDENGNPVERTPLTNPYNFDGYVEWDNPKLIKKANRENASSVYSDRMYQWDYAKAETTHEAAFGNRRQNGFGYNPEKTEKWLQLYNDNNSIQLYRIMKYCNQSSGYPCWRFDYIYTPKPETEK